MVFLCCSPSAARFSMSCIQRCSLSFFGCNELLFELPFSSKQPGHCPVTSGINEAFSSGELQCTGYFLFFVNLTMALWKNPSRSALSELFRPACLAPITMPQSKSLKLPFFPKSPCSLWTSASHLDCVCMSTCIELLCVCWLDSCVDVNN